MSTHAAIFVENGDGSLNGVQLRFDGYLKWTGLVLSQGYKSIQKSRELVSYGDIYALGVDLASSRLVSKYGIIHNNVPAYEALSFEEQSDLREEDQYHTTIPFRDCIDNDAKYFGYRDNQYPEPKIMSFDQISWASDQNQIAHFRAIDDLTPDNMHFDAFEIYVMKKCRSHYTWYFATPAKGKYVYVPLENAIKKISEDKNERIKRIN